MKNYLLFLALLVLINIDVRAQFIKGHYYTKDGKKHIGLIRFNYGTRVFSDKSDGDCTITYKENKKAKKKELTTNDVSSFVIEKDSFTIIKNFRYNDAFVYPQDFARVVDTGKINLYQYYNFKTNTYSSGIQTIHNVHSYVIEIGDGVYTRITNANLREKVMDNIKDYPELHNRINTKGMRVEDTEWLIKLYNQHWR